MNRRVKWITGMALMVFAVGCGSGGNSAQGVFQGQQFNLHVQDVNCVAGPATGPAITGDGVLDAPLVCTISYDTNTFFSDFLQITVSDVRPIYAQRDVWHVLDGSLLSARFTRGGIPQPIYAGLINFSEISNVVGHKVCADYQVQIAEGEIQGRFCGKVRVGF